MAFTGSSLVSIADLSPDIPATNSVIHGIITLVWPYSSVNHTYSFLLVEPDFRLRRNRGQVRISLCGSCARRVTRTGLVSGDEIYLALDGARWERDGTAASTPGRGIEWQLLYTDHLRLERVTENGDNQAIDTSRMSVSPKIQASVLPTVIDRIVATQSTPKVVPTSNKSFNAWSSPIFIKDKRLPDIFPLKDDDSVSNIEEEWLSAPPAKKLKFGRKSDQWRFIERSPSPESDAELVLEPDSTDELQTTARSPSPSSQLVSLAPTKVSSKDASIGGTTGSQDIDVSDEFGVEILVAGGDTEKNFSGREYDRKLAHGGLLSEEQAVKINVAPVPTSPHSLSAVQQEITLKPQSPSQTTAMIKPLDITSELHTIPEMPYSVPNNGILERTSFTSDYQKNTAETASLQDESQVEVQSQLLSLPQDSFIGSSIAQSSQTTLSPSLKPQLEINIQSSTPLVQPMSLDTGPLTPRLLPLLSPGLDLVSPLEQRHAPQPGNYFVSRLHAGTELDSSSSKPNINSPPTRTVQGFDGESAEIRSLQDTSMDEQFQVNPTEAGETFFNDLLARYDQASGVGLDSTVGLPLSSSQAVIDLIEEDQIRSVGGEVLDVDEDSVSSSQLVEPSFAETGASLQHDDSKTISAQGVNDKAAEFPEIGIPSIGDDGIDIGMKEQAEQETQEDEEDGERDDQMDAEIQDSDGRRKRADNIGSSINGYSASKRQRNTTSERDVEGSDVEDPSMAVPSMDTLWLPYAAMSRAERAELIRREISEEENLPSSLNDELSSSLDDDISISGKWRDLTYKPSQNISETIESIESSSIPIKETRTAQSDQGSTAQVSVIDLIGGASDENIIAEGSRAVQDTYFAGDSQRDKSSSPELVEAHVVEVVDLLGSDSSSPAPHPPEDQFTLRSIDEPQQEIATETAEVDMEMPAAGLTLPGASEVVSALPKEIAESSQLSNSVSRKSSINNGNSIETQQQEFYTAPVDFEEMEEEEELTQIREDHENEHEEQLIALPSFSEAIEANTERSSTPTLKPRPSQSEQHLPQFSPRITRSQSQQVADMIGSKDEKIEEDLEPIPETKSVLPESLDPAPQGIRTVHDYYSPLTALSQYHNSTISLLAVVVALSKPIRSTAGPRDYNQTVYVTAPHSQLNDDFTIVQIFRPYLSALLHPVSSGAIILLKNFKVQPYKRKMSLLSTSTSAWAVFDQTSATNQSEMQVSITGPPVDFGGAERGIAWGLGKWWNSLDADLQAKITSAATVTKDRAEADLEKKATAARKAREAKASSQTQLQTTPRRQTRSTQSQQTIPSSIPNTPSTHHATPSSAKGRKPGSQRAEQSPTPTPTPSRSQHNLRSSPQSTTQDPAHELRSGLLYSDAENDIATDAETSQPTNTGNTQTDTKQDPNIGTAAGNPGSRVKTRAQTRKGAPAEGSGSVQSPKKVVWHELRDGAVYRD